MTTPHNMKQMQGFTLVELIIVIAIIGILSAMAAPSMMTMIHKNQLRKETRDFLAVLNEARAEAVLKRTTVYLGEPVTSNDRDIKYDTWSPKNANVEWEISPAANTPIAFDFMGRINVTNNISNCLILRHKTSTELKSVIMLYRQGAVRYLKDATECP